MRYRSWLNIGLEDRENGINLLNNVGGRNVALMYFFFRIWIISSGLSGGGAISTVPPTTSILIANDRPAPKKRGVSKAK